jgi:hypothetical protein
MGVLDGVNPPAAAHELRDQPLQPGSSCRRSLPGCAPNCTEPRSRRDPARIGIDRGATLAHETTKAMPALREVSMASDVGAETAAIAAAPAPAAL